MAAGETLTPPKDDLQALIMSFSVILVSEIGDKTFFIAAIMAMKNSRMLIFSAAMGALFVMTVLSALVGHVAPLLLSKYYTQLLVSVLFLVFGVRMLKDAYSMTGNEGQEEMQEVAAELDSKEAELKADLLESGGTSTSAEHQPFWKRTAMGTRNLAQLLFSPVWLEAFVLTFLAEWGDRSQIATVALAGAEDFWPVTIGSLCGHAVCSSVAVIGGRMLAARISVKTVTVLGGVLFIIFGFLAFYEVVVYEGPKTER
ncbi:hypothetical protein HDU85_007101 [Gaertneriomyces sp. JEL0708]|nr:hypothetical protein HDU85_007101 [Gaertneriomyces sp. JEL0708]